MTQNSGPEDGQDMVTGVQKETLRGHDMVTGATELIDKCHDMTGVNEEVTYFPLVHPQGSRRKIALPVNRNSANETPLRRSNQTKYCWPFRNWQITFLRTSKITSTEFPNCQSH